MQSYTCVERIKEPLIALVSHREWGGGGGGGGGVCILGTPPRVDGVVGGRGEKLRTRSLSIPTPVQSTPVCPKGISLYIIYIYIYIYGKPDERYENNIILAKC